MGRARRNSGLGGCGNIPRIARHRHEVCIPVDGAKYKLDTLGAPKREIVKLGIVKIKTAEQLTNLEVRMSKSLECRQGHRQILGNQKCSLSYLRRRTSRDVSSFRSTNLSPSLSSSLRRSHLKRYDLLGLLRTASGRFNLDDRFGFADRLAVQA